VENPKQLERKINFLKRGLTGAALEVKYEN
jgi:hypothetical protein